MGSLIRIIYFLFVFLIFNHIRPFSNVNIFCPSTSLQTKGIAAILIVIGHCVAFTRIEPLRYLNVGEFCVSIFFFWSGYGITYGSIYKQNYLKSFWRTRLIKLFIPFLLVHLVYLPVKICMGYHFTFTDILTSFVGQLSIVDYSWYPFAVLLFYFTFWCISKVIASKKLRIILLVFASIIISVAEYFIFTDKQEWWYVSNLSFIFGIVVAFIEPSRKHSIIVGSSSLLLGLSAIFMIPCFYYILGKYHYIVYAVSSNLQYSCIAVTAIILFGLRETNNRILCYIGKISYEVYLLHGIFIFILTKCGFYSFWIIPIVLCSSIASSALFHWCCNKIIRFLLPKD